MVFTYICAGSLATCVTELCVSIFSWFEEMTFGRLKLSMCR